MTNKEADSVRGTRFFLSNSGLFSGDICYLPVKIVIAANDVFLKALCR